MSRDIRSMLRRVAKLELSKVSRFTAFGTDQFDAQMRADVVSRGLDRTDMLGADGRTGVLAALQRWAREL